MVTLVEETARLPGNPFIALTTNGVLLPKPAAPLRKAGLRRVNISLDTLDPDRFRQITRRHGLEKIVRDRIWEKPWGHELAQRRFTQNRGMSEIGG